MTGIQGPIIRDETCGNAPKRDLVLVDGLELSEKLREKRGETWRSLALISPEFEKCCADSNCSSLP